MAHVRLEPKHDGVERAVLCDRDGEREVLVPRSRAGAIDASSSDVFSVFLASRIEIRPQPCFQVNVEHLERVGQHDVRFARRVETRRLRVPPIRVHQAQVQAAHALDFDLREAREGSQALRGHDGVSGREALACDLVDRSKQAHAQPAGAVEDVEKHDVRRGAAKLVVRRVHLVDRAVQHGDRIRSHDAARFVRAAHAARRAERKRTALDREDARGARGGGAQRQHPRAATGKAQRHDVAFVLLRFRHESLRGARVRARALFVVQRLERELWRGELREVFEVRQHAGAPRVFCERAFVQNGEARVLRKRRTPLLVLHVPIGTGHGLFPSHERGFSVVRSASRAQPGRERASSRELMCHHPPARVFALRLRDGEELEDAVQSRGVPRVWRRVVYVNLLSGIFRVRYGKPFVCVFFRRRIFRIFRHITRHTIVFGVLLVEPHAGHEPGARLERRRGGVPLARRRQRLPEPVMRLRPPRVERDAPNAVRHSLLGSP